MKPSRRTPAALFVLCVGIVFLNLTGNIAGVQAQQVQVTAADPQSAEQGTATLDVKVTGKGFKNGAKAKWFVTGTTDTGGVTVNSTTFVSTTELRANITVSDTAVISGFDIQVLNNDGRGGKGTELFRVTAKGNNLSCPAPQPAPSGDTKCYLTMSGCLDSTFDGVGYVHINTNAIQSQDTHSTGVVVQPDGKIVVAGYVYVATGDADFVLIRYNVDGSLDTSFGDVDPFNPTLRRGFTITKITTGSDTPRIPLLQADGKIILGGASPTSTNPFIVRYHIDGTLDSSFGNAGVAFLNFGKRVESPKNELALQADGKILICGVSNSAFAVVRLLSNGAPDTSFGSGGLATVNPSTRRAGYGWGTSLAVQRVPAITGEERILVAGLTDNWDWTVIRLRSNGALDTSFGNSGTVKTAFNGFRAEPKRIRVDSNNRPIVAGYTYNASTDCGSYATDFASARYTQDGNLDGSFGGGRQTVDIYGGADHMYDLTIQTDDKIVVVGSANSSDGSVGHIGLVRFNADGTRDVSFGLSGNGTVTTELYGTKGWGVGIAIDPQTGKLVVVSRTFLPPDFNDVEIAVVRYLP